MSRIWRYVLAIDRGRAPCIDGGLLTLCTCKPRIRSGADVGDWVIGFAPKRLGTGRVTWTGCVSEILSMGDYGERYAERGDAIYRRVGWHADGRENLQHDGGLYHNTPKAIATDLRGRRALMFDPFWYWGADAPEAPPSLAELAHYHVGQTTRGSTPEAIDQLRGWLSGWPPGIHGRPRDHDGSSKESASRARTSRASPSASC